MDVLDLFLVENRVHLNGHISVTQDFPSIWNARAIVREWDFILNCVTLLYLDSVCIRLLSIMDRPAVRSKKRNISSLCVLLEMVAIELFSEYMQ